MLIHDIVMPSVSISFDLNDPYVHLPRSHFVLPTDILRTFIFSNFTENEKKKA